MVSSLRALTASNIFFAALLVQHFCNGAVTRRLLAPLHMYLVP